MDGLPSSGKIERGSWYHEEFEYTPDGYLKTYFITKNNGRVGQRRQFEYTDSNVFKAMVVERMHRQNNTESLAVFETKRVIFDRDGNPDNVIPLHLFRP